MIPVRFFFGGGGGGGVKCGKMSNLTINYMYKYFSCLRKSEWVNGRQALETNQFEKSSLSDLLQYRGQSIVSSDETTYTGY